MCGCVSVFNVHALHSECDIQTNKQTGNRKERSVCILTSSKKKLYVFELRLATFACDELEVFGRHSMAIFERSAYLLLAELGSRTPNGPYYLQSVRLCKLIFSVYTLGVSSGSNKCLIEIPFSLLKFRLAASGYCNMYMSRSISSWSNLSPFSQVNAITWQTWGLPLPCGCNQAHYQCNSISHHSLFHQSHMQTHTHIHREQRCSCISWQACTARIQHPPNSKLFETASVPLTLQYTSIYMPLLVWMPQT